MSRRLAIGTGVLVVGISLLHGCRIGYELLPDGLSGAGGVAGDAAGGEPGSRGGTSEPEGGNAPGSAGSGEVGGVAGSSIGGTGGAGGEAGAPPAAAGEGGGGAGGESSGGTLPPLPCGEPLVWSTDFSSDPTALDNNGDQEPDWVIRGGAPFPTAELVAGVWRPATAQALDTFPPVNFTGHTQARVRMRDTNQTAPAMPSAFGGALFWINLDYQPSDFLAVFSSITTSDGVSYDLGVFANTSSDMETLAGPLRLADDGFRVVELDFDPTTGAISTWVDGVPLPIAPPTRQTSLNQDQFATVIAPQATAEFDELWVATCTP